MPMYISISDKSILFDGCPTAKLEKNKRRALDVSNKGHMNYKCIHHLSLYL